MNTGYFYGIAHAIWYNATQNRQGVALGHLRCSLSKNTAESMQVAKFTKYAGSVSVNSVV